MTLKKEYKVLFVCLGNICRSPAAQGIFESYVNKGKSNIKFIVDSAGTYSGHSGDLPDSRMRAHAQKRGYKLTHRARAVRMSDFDNFDIILAMDDTNYYNLINMAPTLEDANKVKKMASYCKTLECDCVPDPYYGGSQGFDLVIDMLEDSCYNLYLSLNNETSL